MVVKQQVSRYRHLHDHLPLKAATEIVGPANWRLLHHIPSYGVQDLSSSHQHQLNKFNNSIERKSWSQVHLPKTT